MLRVVQCGSAGISESTRIYVHEPCDSPLLFSSRHCGVRVLCAKGIAGARVTITLLIVTTCTPRTNILYLTETVYLADEAPVYIVKTPSVIRLQHQSFSPVILNHTEDGKRLVSRVQATPVAKVVCNVEQTSLESDAFSPRSLSHLRLEDVQQRRPVQAALLA
jgi:hypothetical protein